MFGIGESKFAPGTVASFVTCLIYICLYNYQIKISLLLIFLGLLIIFSSYAIDKFKNVFKEILTIYNIIEKNNFNHFILYTFLSFILFRIFDIWKPYPINKIDNEMKNGFGVILDDLVAGVFSAIILLTFIFFINYG